jgi:hypothetical protein
MNTGLTRRRLLALLGTSAAVGCHTGESTSKPDRQQTTAQTVTLIVDGMI